MNENSIRSAHQNNTRYNSNEHVTDIYANISDLNHKYSQLFIAHEIVFSYKIERSRKYSLSKSSLPPRPKIFRSISVAATRARTPVFFETSPD